VADEVLSAGGTWEQADDSDIVVALARSAFIIAIIGLPAVNLVRQTPEPTRLAAVVAAVYTLALFVSRLSGRWLPLQRPLAVGVDLFMITAAIIAWPLYRQVLFQVYYIVVIVAAMWFGRRGAAATAFLAMGAYVSALLYLPNMHTGFLDIMSQLTANGAPVLLILALVSSYVLRARERERARTLRLQHELQLARSMQREMLPEELPKIAGYELAVRLVTAREVSGDLYGFLPVAEDSLLIWVADVAGKGVYGMMHVSLLYSHLRTAAMEGLAPAAIAERVNRGVYDALQPASFASVFIAQLELSTGRVIYTNCGHPPPLLLRGGATDEVIHLQTNTPLVGITLTPGYLQLSTEMLCGDVLVITTDGVQEARARDGTLFEDEGLLDTLQGLQAASASEIVTEIVRAIREFSSDEVRDDAIVAVIKRTCG